MIRKMETYILPNNTINTTSTLTTLGIFLASRWCGGAIALFGGGIYGVGCGWEGDGGEGGVAREVLLWCGLVGRLGGRGGVVDEGREVCRVRGGERAVDERGEGFLGEVEIHPEKMKGMQSQGKQRKHTVIFTCPNPLPQNDPRK